MPTPRPRGLLTNLLALVILAVVLVYAVAGVTSPWPFHIGGRWTPLLYWEGRGTLVMKSGAPILSTFSPGTVQSMKLSGTVFGGWRSTEGSLIQVRLLEWKIVDVGQPQGYFDLYGHWRGTELAMDDRGLFGLA